MTGESQHVAERFRAVPIAIHMRGVMNGSSEVEGVKLGDATLRSRSANDTMSSCEPTNT